MWGGLCRGQQEMMDYRWFVVVVDGCCGFREPKTSESEGKRRARDK